MPKQPDKPSINLPATVEKIIKTPDPREPEKAQINIEQGADPLYKELRIENSLTDAEGNEVSLKKGAKVQVTVEVNPSGTILKPEI